MIGLVAALLWVAHIVVFGAVYALWFDPKSPHARGAWRRLL